MNLDRRSFLGVAGLSALGAAGAGAFEVVRPGSESARPPQAGTGVRWGLVIDPVRCREREGCRDCIAACHREHNVPDLGRPAHEVKWIWKVPLETALGDDLSVPPATRDAPTLVLCNHCDKPPCVRVCPTQATWRRDDGVVMMDWHRCIGCRYCVAACPYGSRSFNYVDPRPHLAHQNPDFPTRSKGVVEKCTLCEARLAEGRLPACVEACPAQAMVFGDLNDKTSPVHALLETRYALRRKPGLGTQPAVYYLL